MSKTDDTERDSGVPDSTETVPSKARAKEVFVQWLATPEVFRVPKTIRDFAAEIAVSERTLFRWRAQFKVQDRVREIVNTNAKARYSDVCNAVIDAAVGGDVQAQKLYLTHFANSKSGEGPREIVVRFGDEEIVPFFERPENFGGGKKSQ